MLMLDKNLAPKNEQDSIFWSFGVCEKDKIPKYWSPRRDIELLKFVRNSDILSGAIGTFCSIVSNVTFNVVTEDIFDIKKHKKCIEFQDKIKYLFDAGGGWISFSQKFAFDYLTSDNGVFAEIIYNDYEVYDGVNVGVGQPVYIKILENTRCERTGDYFKPVIYHGVKKSVLLHRTCVFFCSSLPNTAYKDVGFCSVSRCIDSSYIINAIQDYKSERMIGKPTNGIIITRGGLSPSNITAAITEARKTDNNYYVQIPVVGSQNAPDADIKYVDYSALPEWFNESETTNIAMTIVSTALGADPAEIFPILQSSGSRASSIVNHNKQNRKGYSEILLHLENFINNYYLPDGYNVKFEFKDLAEAERSAKVANIQSMVYERYSKLDVVTTSMQRQMLRKEGVINTIQYEISQYEYGLNFDGTDILINLEDEYISEICGINYNIYDKKNWTEENLLKIREKKSKVGFLYKNNRNNKNYLISYFILSKLEKIFSPNDDKIINICYNDVSTDENKTNQHFVNPNEKRIELDNSMNESGD